jgi:hypothetical protein
MEPYNEEQYENEGWDPPPGEVEGLGKFAEWGFRGQEENASPYVSEDEGGRVLKLPGADNGPPTPEKKAMAGKFSLVDFVKQVRASAPDHSPGL